MHKNYAIYIKLLKFRRIIYIYTHAYSLNVNRSIKMGFSVKAKCIKLISPVSTVRTDTEDTFLWTFSVYFLKTLKLQ